MTKEESISLLKKAIDNLSKALAGFYKEPPKYLRTEMLHPKKKPRGSIRRKRKRRIVYAKDAYEIGKALYEGMMDGFEQGESEVEADETNN